MTGRRREPHPAGSPRRFPAAELPDARARWAAVGGGPGHARFEHVVRARRHAADQILRDAGEVNLQPPAPRSVPLPGVRADVDIDEPRAARSLNDRSAEVGWSTRTRRSYGDADLERQIAARGSLRGDRLVLRATTLLDAEVQTCRRRLEDDSQRTLVFIVRRV